jgi:hypothetical protein
MRSRSRGTAIGGRWSLNRCRLVLGGKTSPESAMSMTSCYIEFDAIVLEIINENGRDPGYTDSQPHVISMVAVEDGAGFTIDQEGFGIGAPAQRHLVQSVHVSRLDLLVRLEPFDRNQRDLHGSATESSF